MEFRFLQIHTLTPFAATLLNRDDIGKAKRLPFGGRDRVRVSSQCLKRHWRTAAGEWSLADLGAGLSVRSRGIFSKVIAGRLREKGLSDERIVAVLTPLRAAVLGESAKAKAARATKGDAGSETNGAAAPVAKLVTDQVIVLGEPEISFLTDLAFQLSQDPEPEKAAAAYFDDKAHIANLKSLGAGLDAALFGRMVTSDIMARSDAAVHVAHSFTVHEEEAEPDYFSALDDLSVAAGELGSGHINTSELTSGLFYSYVVVDCAKLVENLGGDAVLAQEVLRRFLHLVATVSPGAKLGSTAPYACAEFLVAEAGSRQPRTLANAYMRPVPKHSDDLKAAAVDALGKYLAQYDAMYGTNEERRVASMIEPVPAEAGDRVTLDELAAWCAGGIAS